MKDPDEGEVSPLGGPPAEEDETTEANANLSQGQKSNSLTKSSNLITYQIARGRFGFGFTLSGQYPCILSSVLPQSPAQLAGLRPGDSLLAVNGQNVARFTHNEVVRLISQSQGLIRVQVGCTPPGQLDTSSEDEQGAEDNVPVFGETRQRPQLPHHHRRLPNRTKLAGSSVADPLHELNSNQLAAQESREGASSTDLNKIRNRSKPVSRDFRSNSMDSLPTESIAKDSVTNTTEKLALGHEEKPGSTDDDLSSLRRHVDLAAGHELNIGPNSMAQKVHYTRTGKPVATSGGGSAAQQPASEGQAGSDQSTTNVRLKCIVGYLGTIEMNVESGKLTGRQDIKNCIRRLRVEKKVHTMVLFVVQTDRILLINHHGLRLAEFPAEAVSCAGLCEDDRRFFGLVTSQASTEDGDAGTESESNGGCSCHVFMVEPTDSQHERRQRARVFGVEHALTLNTAGDCQEFPSNADSILAAVYAIKGSAGQPSEDEDLEQRNDLEAPSSPQPPGSSNSSVLGAGEDGRAASNSTTNSDSGIGFRDDPSQRVPVGGAAGGGMAPPPAAAGTEASGKLTVRAMPDPANLSASGAAAAGSGNSTGGEHVGNGAGGGNPAEISFNADRLECLQSAEYIRQSMHKYLQNKNEHLRRVSQLLVMENQTGAAAASNGQTSPNINSHRNTGLQSVQQLIKEKFEQRADSHRPGPGLPPDNSEKTPTASVSERSFARSLEDLRSVSQSDRMSLSEMDMAGQPGPPSLPIVASLPLARFLYNSDSNLSQLEQHVASAGGATGPELPGPDPHNHPLHRWLEKQGGGFSSVLRPCDQYPTTDHVVLRSRPRSQISNFSHRSSMIESSDYDNISFSGKHSSAASTINRNQNVHRRARKDDKRELERMSFHGDLDSLASRWGSGTLDRRRDSQLGPERRGSSNRTAGTSDRLAANDLLSGSSLERRQGPQQASATRQRRKSDSESIIVDQSEDKGKSLDKDIGRVGGWAADFDKLLHDPAGLQTFSEFLKKEFSHENIYFWCACERYTRTESGADRLKLAQSIVSKHLGVGASEPVNVDAVARSSTQDSLTNCNGDSPPDRDLFAAAQLQIYNLMKFDSFTRFLKSDLYKDSLLADMGGSPLPFNGVDKMDPDLRIDSSQDESFEGDKSKKKGSEGEGRRKSILPWGNMRYRSKSKDRAEGGSSDKPFLFKAIKLPGQVGVGVGRLSLSSSNDQQQQSSGAASGSKKGDSTTDQQSPSSAGSNSASKGGGEPNNNNNSMDSANLSSSSLKSAAGQKSNNNANSNAAINHHTESCTDRENCSLTRFILPDKATTVVTPNQGETIRSLVSKLLERRGLRYTSFDAFVIGNEKPLDLSEDSSVLGCAEIRVEPRVLFRLELPSKKSIGVKAKQTKVVEEVLRPILHQYGFNLDHMIVQMEIDMGNKCGVDYASTVLTIDNSRLVVSYKPEYQNREGLPISSRISDTESFRTDSRPNSRSSDQHLHLSSQQAQAGRRRSTSSLESSTGGPLARSASGPRANAATVATMPLDEDTSAMPPPIKIPSFRRRQNNSSSGIHSSGSSNPNVSRDQEASLYEGLKRMTKGRLDDQRGLEINNELPDFLKEKTDKEMQPKEGNNDFLSHGSNRSRESLDGVNRSRESHDGVNRSHDGDFGREQHDGRPKEGQHSSPGSWRHNRDDLLTRLSGPAELGDIHGWDRDHAARYLDYIDSTFTADGGLVPTREQAEQFFNPGFNPDESFNFNESRLSFGMGRLSIDGMRVVSRPSIGYLKDYEVLGRVSTSSGLVPASGAVEKDYEPILYRSVEAPGGSVPTSGYSNKPPLGLPPGAGQTSGYREDTPPTSRMSSGHPTYQNNYITGNPSTSYPAGAPPASSMGTASKPPLSSSQTTSALGSLAGNKPLLSSSSSHGTIGPLPPGKPLPSGVGGMMAPSAKPPPPPLPPKPSRNAAALGAGGSGLGGGSASAPYQHHQPQLLPRNPGYYPPQAPFSQPLVPPPPLPHHVLQQRRMVEMLPPNSSRLVGGGGLPQPPPLPPLRHPGLEYPRGGPPHPPNLRFPGPGQPINWAPGGVMASRAVSSTHHPNSYVDGQQQVNNAQLSPNMGPESREQLEMMPGVVRTKNGVYLGVPGDAGKGYNVSFV